MLCEYGCRQEAKYFLKFKHVPSKWCCEKTSQKCPSNKSIPWNKNKTNVYSKKAIDQMSKSKIGIKVGEETRNKLSMLHKEKKKKKQHKIKISKSLKGRCLSKEHKERISISQKGIPRKKHTEQTKRKMSLSKMAHKNPGWLGGISNEPYCFEFTKDLKEFIKERDGYKCTNPFCYKTCEKLCVHHINYNKKECDIKNLITVCLSCNARANFNRECWQEVFKKILN